MTETSSKAQVLLARMTVVLVIALIAIGLAWYGVSAEEIQRIWQNILARPGGPMTFRFILQPAMAAIAALHDGAKDARMGRSPYFWTLLTNEADRGERLWEGLISTARIILLGLVMDTIYQFFVLKTFYPVEAVIVSLTLAFLPYVILRGPIARVARWWAAKLQRTRSGEGTSP
jgi:predicted small integral membrane protein